MPRDPEELRWKRLLKQASAGEIGLTELPKFPGIETDDAQWDPIANPVGTLPIEGAACRVELLNQLKSGKEATVYCCRAVTGTQERLIAVKRFLQITQRAFRNDTPYRIAKHPRTERRGRPQTQDTEDGLQARFSEWVAREYDTLSLLHRAGADVPKPLGRTGPYVLMEFIGDAERVAPLLHRVHLPKLQAQAVFDRLMANVRLFLALNRVHGDLSAFNVLFQQDRPVIIDFPQAVDPRDNPTAEALLHRDIGNLCRWLEQRGGYANAGELAGSMWTAFQRGALVPEARTGLG